MRDKIENDIIETFEKHQIKLTSADILEKVNSSQRKKYKIFSFSFGGISLALAATLIAVFSFGNSNSIYNEKIISPSYISDIVGSINTLNNNTALLKKAFDDNSLENHIIDAYNKIEKTIVANINEEHISITHSTKKESFNNIQYSNIIEITDEIFNQNYRFLYNLDDNELNGVIYNSSLDLSNLLNLKYSIKVESVFTKIDQNIYSSSIFTPQINDFGLYHYSINEHEDGSYEYKYLLGETELYNFIISYQKNSIYVSYHSELIELEFQINKNNSNSLSISYSLSSLLEGEFDVLYNSDGSYEIQ